MAIRTLRGTLTSGERRRLILDDGQFTHAVRVRAFRIWGVDPTVQNNDCAGVLALDEDGLQVNFRADDNRQIGWAGYYIAQSYAANPPWGIIDPDHIVVRDLWITANATAGEINFMVELETVTITEEEAVLALIKERSQDDL